MSQTRLASSTTRRSSITRQSRTRRASPRKRVHDLASRAFSVGVLAAIAAAQEDRRAGRLWSAVEDLDALAPGEGWRHRDACEARVVSSLIGAGLWQAGGPQPHSPRCLQRRQHSIPHTSRRRLSEAPYRYPKTLLTAEIPAYPRLSRKHHDRPVTPEVAGSSPVAPVENTLQIGIFCCQRGRNRPPAFGAFPSLSRTRRKVAVCKHFRSSADCMCVAIPRPLHSATAFRLIPAPKTVPVVLLPTLISPGAHRVSAPHTKR